MGVLDIIDTNRVELSKPPAVQLAMKEVRYPAQACRLFFSSYPVISPGCSHITQYQEGSSTNKKSVSPGFRLLQVLLIT